MKEKRLAKYAWFVLLYNLLVILWGAYVRATGSGAGCGAHWPLCNGEVFPRTNKVETIIEFSHRISSGLALLLVFILVVWVIRLKGKQTYTSRAAIFSGVFIVSEALVGAGLVLFELVANDASAARAFSIVIHLVNTFLLIGSISITAWWLSFGEPEDFHLAKPLKFGLLTMYFAVILIGVSGAITALGDTLFPAQSLAEGIKQDISPTSHFLIRLRVFHPFIAVASSLMIFTVIGIVIGVRGSPRIKKIGWSVIFLVIFQLIAGVVNLVLLAPVFMQLIHLFLADVIWILLVLFGVNSTDVKK